MKNCDELFSYMIHQGERCAPRKNKSLVKMRKFAKITRLNTHGIKIIHIAGSKGKGSLGIHLSTGLKALNYRVGLYTSPHVSHWFERILMIDEPMDQSLLLQIGHYLKQCCHENNCQEEFNFFEWMTVLAMHYFIQKRCDYVILETGLGGRVDSTNIFTPVATVSTLIELEHTEILGNSVEKIAREKAGILKPNVMHFTYHQLPSVEKIFRQKALSLQNQFYSLKEFLFCLISCENRHYAQLSNGKKFQFETALYGHHQGENAVLALYILEKLLGARYKKNFNDILSSFKQAFLPGRFQPISSSPLIIVDSAHTNASVRASVETIRPLIKNRKVAILFGCGAFKDSFSMLKTLRTLSDDITITKPGDFKASNLTKIEIEAKEHGFKVTKYEECQDACSFFIENLDPKIVYFIIGSFYLSDIFLTKFNKFLNGESSDL